MLHQKKVGDSFVIRCTTNDENFDGYHGKQIIERHQNVPTEVF